MDINQLFWNASIIEMKQGYQKRSEDKGYLCLICGKTYEEGVIYPYQSHFLDAKKRMEVHIEDDHGSVFHYLLNLNQKYTGLSEIQKELMISFYQGLTDKEILQTKKDGSLSTIRNHRFKLKEREKQAKIFLSLMELLSSKQKGESYMTIPKTATLVDERFDVTEEEYQTVLKNYIVDGKLTTFPSKEKRKAIILTYFIKKFEANKNYSEKEVNAIIKEVYDDYVTIRRYLIEYGYLDRLKDGSKYWLNV